MYFFSNIIILLNQKEAIRKCYRYICKKGDAYKYSNSLEILKKSICYFRTIKVLKYNTPKKIILFIK